MGLPWGRQGPGVAGQAGREPEHSAGCPGQGSRVLQPMVRGRQPGKGTLAELPTKARLCRQPPQPVPVAVSPWATCSLPPSQILYIVVKSVSRVRLLVTPWTVAHQAPLSMGFSRQAYWSGLPFPSPGDLPEPGIRPRYTALQGLTQAGKPALGPQGDNVAGLLSFS